MFGVEISGENALLRAMSVNRTTTLFVTLEAGTMSLAYLQ
jgi:hypothetical protein